MPFHRRKIFEISKKLAVPIAGVGALYLAQEAVQRGVPKRLVKAALMYGSQYMTDDAPDTTNPTFGYQPSDLKDLQRVVRARGHITDPNKYLHPHLAGLHGSLSDEKMAEVGQKYAGEKIGPDGMPVMQGYEAVSAPHFIANDFRRAVTPSGVRSMPGGPKAVPGLQRTRTASKIGISPAVPAAQQTASVYTFSDTDKRHMQTEKARLANAAKNLGTRVPKKADTARARRAQAKREVAVVL